MLMIINQEISDYAKAHSQKEDPVLQQLYRETWLKVYAPQMIAGHQAGSLLRMISMMIRPHFILEVGTFTGYSAICLADGLEEGGHLHTIEINPELEEMAAKYFKAAGMAGKITQHIGDALTIIPNLSQVFDLVYIDAGKDCYVDIYELSLPKVRKGGFILADNALWYGKVAGVSDKKDKDTEAVRHFNKHVHDDPRTENLLLPVGDGVMIARKV